MARAYAYRTREASPRTRLIVFTRDGFRCLHCGFAPPVPDGYDGRLTLRGIRDDGRYSWLELDHIVPWSAGGAAIPENLQTLCCSCNVRKGARI
jgi:5-methylcytosine-specific restriction endonuclease McrA